MPQAEVLSHANARVQFRIPFDASLASFNFYSSEHGPDQGVNMKLVNNVVAPPNVGGFHNFDMLAADLGIALPQRRWYLRITGITTVDAHEEPLLGTMHTIVPPSNPFRPAYQKKIGTDTPNHIEIELKLPAFAWNFFNYSYKRDFAGATVIDLIKKLTTGEEVQLNSFTMGASATSRHFDRAIELVEVGTQDLKDGESLLFRTSGPAPAGAEKHEVSISWDPIPRGEGIKVGL